MFKDEFGMYSNHMSIYDKFYCTHDKLLQKAFDKLFSDCSIELPKSLHEIKDFLMNNDYLITSEENIGNSPLKKIKYRLYHGEKMLNSFTVIMKSDLDKGKIIIEISFEDNI